jgi:amidophosphoribosyltransferase
MVASESVAVDAMGFRLLRDIAPGEAVFIDEDGKLYSQQCAERTSLNPCIFEYVYLARPDSIIDGASVYETRLRMGEKLVEKIKRRYSHLEIDVVIPIPDSSRPSAMQLALGLGVPYREGFVKNRYIGRTFIMRPGGAQALGAAERNRHGIQGQNVLLVDDSIVRGTTSREIVQMARESGARKVFRLGRAAGAPASTASTCRLARSDRRAPRRGRVATEIGADALIYRTGRPRDAVRQVTRSWSTSDLVLRRHLRDRRRDRRLPARGGNPARRTA